MIQTLSRCVAAIAPVVFLFLFGMPGRAGETKEKKSPSAADFGLARKDLENLQARGIPFIDFHVHLRGGMTFEKAEARQSFAGIRMGVLRNLGEGWPIETDDQLRAFLDEAEGHSVFVGLQVNDREWHLKHASELLEKCDFFLGDTMIMPMPDESSPPVKLFKPDTFTIEDPEAWMVRYIRHNLRVLAEPITILANPTWLPKAVEDRYDELWTDERMKTVIGAAIDGGVALEINARSGYPSERFIRLAKEMGAKFTFGTNNFDDKPIDMSRCLEAIEKYDLGKADLYVPARR